MFDHESAFGGIYLVFGLSDCPITLRIIDYRRIGRAKTSPESLSNRLETLCLYAPASQTKNRTISGTFSSGTLLASLSLLSKLDYQTIRA
jgi:hypothetical protein